jgi:hypothetical protein
VCESAGDFLCCPALYVQILRLASTSSRGNARVREK